MYERDSDNIHWTLKQIGEELKKARFKHRSCWGWRLESLSESFCV